jgi:hypothetical protein
VVLSEGQTASSVLYIPRLNEAAASLEAEPPAIPLRKVSSVGVAVVTLGCDCLADRPLGERAGRV